MAKLRSASRMAKKNAPVAADTLNDAAISVF
jgi:hypothetical protein